MYELLSTFDFNGGGREKSFWKSMQVYLERPNILNKRIFGCQFTECFEVFENCEKGCDLFVKTLKIKYGEKHLSEPRGILSNLLESQSYLSVKNEVNMDIKSWLNERRIIVVMRKLLPRMKPKFSEEFELILINTISNDCLFFPLSGGELRNRLTPDLSYRFLFIDENSTLLLKATTLNLDKLLDFDKPSVVWLKKNVFPKISKWSALENQEETSSTIPLHLIEIENYNNLRLKLRDRYADYFIKIWPDDSTDPLKFVHEDIAIAAYLISLWELENHRNNSSKKQSFVDLGCGNGLLVHILVSEGYPGIGIDLRRRKLWDILNCGTMLKEMTITPSLHSLFPGYDWLIGNHSDELTPWIPVIAARSSYTMRVFLLPCCSFTFDGKFERKNGGISQYQSYLLFVENLCSVVGFNVEKDKLRIPSTKRSCFICYSRNYPESEELEVDERRTKFIEENSKVSIKVESSETWADGFIPRTKTPTVTNCTQLDRKFLEDIVCIIADILLSRGEEFHEVKTSLTVKKFKYGGTISLSQLAKELNDDMKVKLKQQNGGLQTLIRNHRHIFEVKDGNIFITKPLMINYNQDNSLPSKIFKGKKKPIPFQRRNCWFFKNHPEGCPLSQSECRYSHKNIDCVL